ncbi:hypothetical protein BU15DRAFT_59896 [Melanogaster broomeanus]|nr:hypothetical protein BU15DRAFT_59896 [Melanogaster broomeanus]
MDNTSPSSAQTVPSIHIHNTDSYSSYFNVADAYFPEMSNTYPQTAMTEDNSIYNCSPSLLDTSYTGTNPSASPFDLEEIGTELSHLTTMRQPPYLTGPDFSLPYSDQGFSQESSPVDGGLTASGLHSPMPSPSSSFNGSFSPASFYSEALSLSDIESPNSPSPATPEEFLFPPSNSLVRRRVIRPVASPAMLDANTRRRRHPAQHTCETCGQTFTAVFSLKRHAQSHTGERPYTCSIPGCGQQFFNNSDCKRHEKSRKRHKDLV